MEKPRRGAAVSSCGYGRPAGEGLEHRVLTVDWNTGAVVFDGDDGYCLSMRQRGPVALVSIPQKRCR